MKVLVFSHEFPPCLGGAGTIANFLYQNFTDDKNFDVTVLTSKRSPSDSNNKIYTPKLSKKFWFFAYLPWLLINNKKFDIIILNDPAAIYTAGVILSKKQRKKSICIIHGVEKHLKPSNFFIKLINFPYFFKKSLKNSKKVVFVSNFIKKKYETEYNITPTNGIVIHGGVNKIFRTLKEKRLNTLKKSPLKFITVSRIVRGKGYDRMLAIFEILYTMGLSFEWHIVGDGNYRDSLEKNINNSIISDRVILLGKRPENKLPHLLSSYDLYILLSELEESFGLSYLEASACGLIPIGYDSYGIKEAFNYIKTGYLLNNNDDNYILAEKIYAIAKKTSLINNACFRFDESFFHDIKKIIKD
ncbi:glycosyltransferase family 4 protein [Providencia heimbachae]|uniref:Glycosyltransferase n=1 Tax=Providencia heimbachae ATCC 35613 TaxID=1354272 RepID=A0A1B7JU41_9GAMM|nr:glycosyltransferase family 4 protein [Providencia heimbachae]OAT51423.1 glycosyltransferase [Providencia heimbachae ATCC 35613]SQH15821.1 GDP-mannose-dependent alpha-(1-6)-phosphatidylinositol monomannoside mannosyltransferase [Providencia heimbachae]